MNRISKIALNIYQHALDNHETKIVSNILKMESFEPIINIAPDNINRIVFIVPLLKKYAGGHTSILRLGTYLAEKGYDVSYASFHNQDLKQMKNVAECNLKSVKGTFLKYSECKVEKFDICIATSWESVYWTKQMSGYKMYFVQDFEPFFFKLNERYLLALKTYELGFHIVSLGGWNVKQIRKNCKLNGKIENISFPYEPSEYKSFNRDFGLYTKKKIIKMAVYTKEEGKRIPNLLQGILKRTRDALKDYNIELEVNFFGLNKEHKVCIGTNCGKLNKTELVRLYQESDFGMVASMTNISLVPYEMIAVGLPVIEFEEGSYKDFLPIDSAILIDYNYNKLVEKIVYYVNNPEELELMTNRAKSSIKDLSWNNTGNEFEKILVDILGVK